MSQDDLLKELERLSREIESISGLSRYLNPRLDADGLPIDDGVVSGYAMGILMESVRARLGRDARG